MVLVGAERSAPDASLTGLWVTSSVLVLALFDSAGSSPAKLRPRCTGHGEAAVTHRPLLAWRAWGRDYLRGTEPPGRYRLKNAGRSV